MTPALVPVGGITTARFTLDEAATIKIAVLRKVRRGGRRRLVRLPGLIERRAQAGIAELRFRRARSSAARPTTSPSRRSTRQEIARRSSGRSSGSLDPLIPDQPSEESRDAGRQGAMGTPCGDRADRRRRRAARAGLGGPAARELLAGRAAAHAQHPARHRPGRLRRPGRRAVRHRHVPLPRDERPDGLDDVVLRRRHGRRHHLLDGVLDRRFDAGGLPGNVTTPTPVEAIDCWDDNLGGSSSERIRITGTPPGVRYLVQLGRCGTSPTARPAPARRPAPHLRGHERPARLPRAGDGRRPIQPGLEPRGG